MYNPGRRSLTEGRGAYLHPGILARILQRMDQAECFYHDPSCTEILAADDVDYVIRAPARSIGGNLPNFAEGVRSSRLKDVPYLQRAARFGNVYIFRVDHSLLTAKNPKDEERTP